MQATTTINSPTYSNFDLQLAPQGPGLAYTMARGSYGTWGWIQASLAERSPLINVTGTGPGVTAAGIAPIDNTHAALVWQDGNLKTSMMTCGQ